MPGTTVAIDSTIKLGITLPKSIVQKIDIERGDVARSRYILRAIQDYLGRQTSAKKANKRRKVKEIERH